MISLRTHIVTLAAVFLAFGLGILAGTTVIDSGLVAQLRRNTGQLERDLNGLRDDLSGVQRQLSVWEDFGKAIAPGLLEGRLAGRAVVLVVDRDVPGDLVSQVVETLRLSNARAEPTRLTLTDKWSLTQSAWVEQLSLALRTQNADAERVLGDAAARLGSRLGDSGDARAEGDLIRTLGDSGFLDVSDLPRTGPFPAANAMVVVISSGTSEQTPGLDDFFVPLLKALSSTRIVAVAEPTTAARSLAELMRGDRTTARTVSTVDHVDTVAGRLSLVYGLRDLADGKAADHYGTRGGATAIAPDVRPA